jgi:acid phosphatase
MFRRTLLLLSTVPAVMLTAAPSALAGEPETVTVTTPAPPPPPPVTVTVTTPAPPPPPPAPVPVATVTVTPASATLRVGTTVQLSTTLEDSAGNVLTGRTIMWSSSAPTVATVSASGLVTAVAVGSATITATSEGKSGTSAITVTLVPVATVSVAPASDTLGIGTTSQLTATTKDSAGNVLTGRVVTWSSSATGVATVSGSGVVTGVAAGSATITATSEGQSGTASIMVTPPGTAQFGHVFIVTEENTDYVNVTSSSMPYLTGLAAQYGLATQYYANTHPSIGNYFELATGQVLTNDDASSTIENVPNIVRSLLAAGKTWKSYAESIPNACYLGGDTGNYARKHNVFALLSDVANDPTGQACNIVPFTQFATDLANGTLPAFSNIVPNLCNDAHDCPLSTADAWLKNNIGPLIASPVFQQDGLLIITFDEAGADNTLGGGRVYWVAISPKAKRGYQSTTTYQHQSTLRLILEGLGITTFPGAAAMAPDMSEFFNP